MNGSDKQTNLIEIVGKKVQLVSLNLKELKFVHLREKSEGKHLSERN